MELTKKEAGKATQALHDATSAAKRATQAITELRQQLAAKEAKLTEVQAGLG